MIKSNFLIIFYQSFPLFVILSNKREKSAFTSLGIDKAAEPCVLLLRTFCPRAHVLRLFSLFLLRKTQRELVCVHFLQSLRALFVEQWRTFSHPSRRPSFSFLFDLSDSQLGCEFRVAPGSNSIIMMRSNSNALRVQTKYLPNKSVKK